MVLRFKPRMAALHVLVVDRPREIPLTRVNGPINRPKSWGPAHAAASAALWHAGHSEVGPAVAALTVAYRQLANTMADSAANLAGVPGQKHSKRKAGHIPEFKWVHIEELRKPVTPSGLDKAVMSWRWIRDRACELRRLVVAIHEGTATLNMLDVLSDLSMSVEEEGPYATGVPPYGKYGSEVP